MHLELNEFYETLWNKTVINIKYVLWFISLSDFVVQRNMLVEVTLLSELLCTDFSLVWSFSSMDSHVIDEVPSLIELSSTVVM